MYIYSVQLDQFSQTYETIHTGKVNSSLSAQCLNPIITLSAITQEATNIIIWLYIIFQIWSLYT